MSSERAEREKSCDDDGGKVAVFGGLSRPRGALPCKSALGKESCDLRSRSTRGCRLFQCAWRENEGRQCGSRNTHVDDGREPRLSRLSTPLVCASKILNASNFVGVSLPRPLAAFALQCEARQQNETVQLGRFARAQLRGSVESKRPECTDGPQFRISIDLWLSLPPLRPRRGAAAPFFPFPFPFRYAASTRRRHVADKELTFPFFPPKFHAADSTMSRALFLGVAALAALAASSGVEAGLPLNATGRRLSGLPLNATGRKLSGLPLNFTGRRLSGLPLNATGRRLSGLPLNLTGRKLSGLPLNLTGRKLSGLPLNATGRKLSGLPLNATGRKLSGLPLNLTGRRLSGLPLNATGRRLNGLPLNLTGRRLSGLPLNVTGRKLSGLPLNITGRK